MHVENSPSWLRRLSLWRPEGRPDTCDLDQVGGKPGFPWFELVCGAGESAEVFAALRAHCPGLTPQMLEDLLTPDDLPDGRDYDGGRIQLASTFSVVAEHEDEAAVERGTPRKVGRLTFRGVVERWHRGRHGSPADLGVAVMHELALTYVPTQRALVLWLEDWELSLYQAGKKADECELAALWGLMAMMRKWLTPLNRPGLRKDIAKAWLPATDHDAVIEVDERVDKALEGLAKLSETLRAAFGLLHVEQTEEQRQREEKSARRLETIAVAFLVPTLVVGFYGANTWVPGQGRHWGFWVMVGILILLSFLTMVGLRARRSAGAAADRRRAGTDAGRGAPLPRADARRSLS